MSRRNVDQIARRLIEAEGYLELELPSKALEILRSRTDWATMQFEASFLTGMAHRELGQFREALKPLENAASLRPDDLSVALAQGWCYKRTHRLAQAIDALERVRKHHAEVAVVHYNLACYWSLAGGVDKALAALAIALELDSDYLLEIPAESDFDPIRDHPEFGRLTGKCRAG